MEESWTCYRQTYFKVLDVSEFQAFSKHSHSFAIITACNPEGNIATPERNAVATERLRASLASLEHTPVIGRAQDGSHQEYSFAVDIGESEAVALGTAFKQLALFFIDNGGIFLVPCLEKNMPRERIASWHERLLP